MPQDRIQREIEDILSKLDDLPEERKPIKMRRRSRQASKAANNALSSLTSISVKHLMVAALALVVIGFITSQAYETFGRWTLIAGIVLFIASIVLSALSRGTTSPTSPQYEKRWRGEPLELDDNPTFGDRVRSWFGSKRR